MAVLTIRLEDDPVLRRKSQPVDRVTKRINRLLSDMEETMYDANGIGLAAPQVGHLLRVIVVDVGDGLVKLVNPVIESYSGAEIDKEGCLSIPGIVGYVERHSEVTVSGLNEKGKHVRIKADGLFARALQHEIDHLNGILITDKATGIVELDDDEEDENADIGASENQSDSATPDEGRHPQ